MFNLINVRYKRARPGHEFGHELYLISPTSACQIPFSIVNHRTKVRSALLVNQAVCHEGKSQLAPLPPIQIVYTSRQFGKHIQAEQVPGWSQCYLDYKFLKKIVSSLAANRPGSEAAALAIGIRPSDILNTSSSTPSSPAPWDASAPSILSSIGQGEDRGSDFQAHKAAFFFRLERELEKARKTHSRACNLLLILFFTIDQRILFAKRGRAKAPSRNTSFKAEGGCYADSS